MPSFLQGQSGPSDDALIDGLNKYSNEQGGWLSDPNYSLASLWKYQQVVDVDNGTYDAIEKLYGTWNAQPNPSAWVQGQNGDCYFVISGYKVSQDDPGAIVSDISPHFGNDGNWDGSYNVYFPGLNQSTIVSVSASTPLTNPATNQQGIQYNGNGLYAMALEKGWAQLDGGWSGISNGYPSNALFALTGDNNIQTYSGNFSFVSSLANTNLLSGVNIDSSTGLVSTASPNFQGYYPKSIQSNGLVDWSTVANAVNNGQIVLVGTDLNNTSIFCSVNPVLSTDPSLVAGHAYSVESANYDPGTGQLESLVLRNPFGAGPDGTGQSVEDEATGIYTKEPEFTTVPISQLNQYINNVTIMK